MTLTFLLVQHKIVISLKSGKKLFISVIAFVDDFFFKAFCKQRLLEITSQVLMAHTDVWYKRIDSDKKVLWK